ncbi:hypothetical protein Q428_14150 [Fervidicella metallireducens AeB]|uniref:ABC transmembrane type-1 domain-containing protein n=1 Tax=Fervidicella metallireducens AeB TaxID=1403537 RepID=A0A017RR84_9CLOT|nr:hypothetical protein Q428_14150 [Fervidicella metallireducens AeB]
MNNFQEDNFNNHFDFTLWKKLFYYIKPYKKLMFFLSCVMIGVGCIEATFPIMTKYAVDNFIIKGNLNGLTRFSIRYLILVGLQVFNVWCLIALAGKIEVSVCHDIRKKAFEHLQNLSFSYFDTTPTGWIMARMTSDIQRLSDTLAWGVVDFVWGLAMMSFILIYMLYLNWQLA